MLELKEELLDIIKMEPDSDFNHPKIAVMILKRENIYPKIKDVLQDFRIPSQVINLHTAKNFNLTKASNVLK